MASQPHPERISPGFRFEFDPVNKILRLRVEERLTDELAVEIYSAIRKYATATDASAGIRIPQLPRESSSFRGKEPRATSTALGGPHYNHSGPWGRNDRKPIHKLSQCNAESTSDFG